MNLWTQPAAVWAIGPIATLASVKALARSYGCAYRWAVHRRLGDRQAMSWLTELDAFLAVGKPARRVAWLDGWSARPHVQDLHAMESRPVHRSPRQFTRDPAEQVIRSDCITSVHGSSPRTVTSLVTGRRPAGGCPSDPSLFRITRPYQAGLLPHLVRPDCQGPGSAQCTPDRPDRTAGAHARRPA